MSKGPATSASPWDPTFVTDIRDYLLSCEPTEEQLTRRNQALAIIRDISRSLFTCEVIEHGSFFNGFGTGFSDLDVALHLKGASREKLIESAEELKRALAKKSTNTPQVVAARIILVSANIEGISIDISFNTIDPAARTRVLKMCADYDPAIRSLGLIIKRWTKKRGVGKGSMGYLTSYDWTLMLIQFLMKKGIIDHVFFTKGGTGFTHQPIAKETYQTLVAKNEPRKIKSLTINGRTQKSQVDDSRFEELLREFFEYYNSHFDFDVNMVCIRTESSTLLTKTAYLKTREDEPCTDGLCVSDPVDPKWFRSIKKAEQEDTLSELNRAATELRKGGGKFFELKEKRDESTAKRQRVDKVSGVSGLSAA